MSEAEDLLKSYDPRWDTVYADMRKNVKEMWDANSARLKERLAYYKTFPCPPDWLVTNNCHRDAWLDKLADRIEDDLWVCYDWYSLPSPEEMQYHSAAIRFYKRARDNMDEAMDKFERTAQPWCWGS